MASDAGAVNLAAGIDNQMLKLVKNLSSIIVLVLVIIGCRQIQKLSPPSVLKSTDGKFQITVPGGWRDTPSLHEEASIRAANSLNEMYVIVISENKIDFADGITLDKFTDITRDSMMSKLGSPVASPPTKVTINGIPGRQFLLQGEGKTVKIAYLITNVETESHYHQIITWTLLSRISQNQPALQGITESFRAVK